MSDDVIQAVRRGAWRDCHSLSAADRLALELAERATQTPPEVDDAFFDQLRPHFTAPQIVEMAAIIAFENYRARLNVALGIEGHQFYQPAAAKDTLMEE